MRRRAPMLLVALGVAVLLGWYLVYTQRIVRDLRIEAERQARIYTRVYSTLADSTARENEFLGALVSITQQYKTGGIPMILTDSAGRPTDAANLDFAEDLRTGPAPRTRAHVAVLDRQNVPLRLPGGGALHYGDSKLVQGLRVWPALQVGALLMLVGVAGYALVVRARAEREHVWAGMARESAHQLGTPLMSLSGWIALLDEEVEEAGARANPMLASAVKSMKADQERLERVAHRFERIGRPPRRESVDVTALVERIAAYFRARVPSRTHAVEIRAHVPGTPLVVEGDAVLLEWVLESLTKNAVDALAGRGGQIDISADPVDTGGVRLRVADDGPGVPRELRRRIFEAGFSTKERGWGIGLSLAKRIVEENHGGRLQLAAVDRGAAFDVILR